MDLNYLFYRQQIERSRAESASASPIRRIHEELAVGYEAAISRATRPAEKSQPQFQWRAPGPARTVGVNATMAIAVTAREMEGRQR